ncbi:MAG: RNA pseudouridine synthase [Planctomycetales bacterium]|nr:RNA pseudouridine synthase [Planctomycetales bacterium]
MDSQSPQILYEQPPFLVVSKPPGVLTQSPPGIDSLELQLKRFLAVRDGEEDPYIGTPHRLDRPVSGVIIFAKKWTATRKLGKQFQRRKVEKVYWAAVAGDVGEDEGEWRDTMRKVPGEPRGEIVPPDHPEAREALLTFRVLGRRDWGTWLELRPVTGRTHQLRVQAASRGFPILGDEQYGSTVAFGPATDDTRARAIALHARSLLFHDWVEEAAHTVVAPLPDYWQSLGIE